MWYYSIKEKVLKLEGFDAIFINLLFIIFYDLHLVYDNFCVRPFNISENHP